MDLKDVIQNIPVIMQLSEYVQKENIEAYVVGGFVRDSLLKRPSKDIDVVCVGSGISLAKGFAEYAGISGVEYFQNFGTAHLEINDVELEFVGARKESYDRGSRKPIVEDGTLDEDINRRDFTVNAMAISLNNADFGLLVDKFNGIADLHHGVIKTPQDSDITFSDDPLRILRAIRFATQLNFEIDESTFLAIKRNRERLSIISKERIRDEVVKILKAKTPSRGFYMLDEVGILEMILPELTALKGVERIGGKGHKENFKHTLQVLAQAAEVSENIWFRWAALLHDIGKGPTKKFNGVWTFQNHENVGSEMVVDVFKRFCLPLNEKMQYVQAITRLHGRPQQLVEEGVTDSAIRRLCVNAGDVLNDLLLFCKCDITTSKVEKKEQYIREVDNLIKTIESVRERDNLTNFKLPIDGGDIMRKFKLKPGKIVGDIKEAVKEAIIEGCIPNEREAALDYMISIYQTIK